jgi:hypothetical protein
VKKPLRPKIKKISPSTNRLPVVRVREILIPVIKKKLQFMALKNMDCRHRARLVRINIFFDQSFSILYQHGTGMSSSLMASKAAVDFPGNDAL